MSHPLACNFRNYQIILTGRRILITFIIQTDFVFYFATVPAASAITVLDYLYGVQTLSEANNISAHAEALTCWLLLRNGE
jgi:hypothetical protein